MGLRESAQRLGLVEFWRWWTGELRGLLPSKLRGAMQSMRLRPIVVFHPDAAVVLEPRQHQGSISFVEAARVPVRGDASEIAQAGRAAMDALGRKGRRAGAGAPRVMIALDHGQVLRKRLTYPAPVEGNLAQVLAYDLDRHTPFKAEDLYYDARVIARDAARSEIRVELVAALRSLVDQLRRQVVAWGGEVIAVVAEMPSPDRPLPRLNLVPEAERTQPSVWRRLSTWVPIVLVVVLIAAAIALPIMQKRTEAIELLHATEQAQLQATAADALRAQLEQSVEDYNFVLTRKYGYPSTLQLLDDVTRLLPDDTWLTQFEMKSTPKGKEPHREILLRGESANAGRLVSLLEESQLFEQAAPRSPTTKIQPGPGEIFDLGAQLKPLPPPVPVQLAKLGPVTSGAPTPTPASIAPGAAGTPTTPPAPGASAPASTVVGAPSARPAPGAPAPTTPPATTAASAAATPPKANPPATPATAAPSVAPAPPAARPAPVPPAPAAETKAPPSGASR